MDRNGFTLRAHGLDRPLFLAALILITGPQQCLSAQSSAEPQASNTLLEMTSSEFAKTVPELKHLKPAKSQERLPLILQRVGAGVAEFFDNFSNTTCEEQILFTVERPKAEEPVRYEGKFNYLALTKPGADKTALQEYRTDSKGVPVNVKGTVVTAGFVTLPGYFHPNYQKGSRFRFLGEEQVKGRSMLVVAFAQQPGVARQASSIAFDDKGAFVFVQGVAWIDPAKYRILRLRTDVERPELSVGLRWETTEAEYSEVTFKEGGKTMWLPREVTVSGQLKDYTFRNQHRYSGYRFFLVQTEDKQKGS
jgi:hypothetical protein